MDLKCKLHTPEKVFHADIAVKFVMSSLFAKTEKIVFPVYRKTNTHSLRHHPTHMKQINRGYAILQQSIDRNDSTRDVINYSNQRKIRSQTESIVTNDCPTDSFTSNCQPVDKKKLRKVLKNTQIIIR